MTTHLTNMCTGQESFLLKPDEARELLHTLRLSLQRFRHTSDYVKWIEEGVFSGPSQQGQPTTELQVEQIMHILNNARVYCPHVQELYQKMRSLISRKNSRGQRRIGGNNTGSSNSGTLLNFSPVPAFQIPG